LARGDIVVVDNLSSHKLPDVCRAIQTADAWLFLPPPYSPNMNPIEPAPAAVGTYRR